MAAMAGLNRLWQCNNISFASAFNLYWSLAISIFLRGCDTRNLLADSEKKDPGFRNQVHAETSPQLLLGAQDYQLGAEQD